MTFYLLLKQYSKLMFGLIKYIISLFTSKTPTVNNKSPTVDNTTIDTSCQQCGNATRCADLSNCPNYLSYDEK